jgi:putative solute:sodium symporter small subunit
MVAAQKPGTIVSMVAWAFSIAGSALFPALVLGIFWRRATRAGALAGMVVGLAVAIYYIFRVEFDSLAWIGVSGLRMAPWFNVNSTAAGVFGVLSGFATIIVVSLFGQVPGEEGRAFLDRLRRTGAGGQAAEGDRYWTRTQRLTYILLVAWVVITFGLSWYADELNPFKLFGFPLGFYMAAQGSMIIYLAMIWFYNRRMRSLERELGIDNE